MKRSSLKTVALLLVFIGLIGRSSFAQESSSGDPGVILKEATPVGQNSSHCGNGGAMMAAMDEDMLKMHNSMMGNGSNRMDLNLIEN